MFGNYLKIILRNLIRHRIFSFINVIGLAVGITCFVVLALFVIDESGFDTFNEKADQIYRVYVDAKVNGEKSCNSKTAGPLGETLKNNFPEVLNYARIGYFGQHDLRYKDKIFRENGIYTTDPTYFEIFSLPFIYGDSKTALTQPNSIVISETAARKYFGNENPLGKQFIVDNDVTYSITGVMKDFPKKSHFSCNFLLSMNTYPVTEEQNWLDSWYSTYLLFKPGTDPKNFEKKMEKIVLEYVGAQAQKVIGISIEEFFAKGNSYGFYLQPLTSIYLYSQNKYGIDANTEWGNVRSSSVYFSYALLAIGLFILMIAVFNFMNLATAKSENRAREVSVRKTLGSDRTNLVVQFLSESTFTVLLSVIFSIVLAQFMLPVFNEFVGKELKLELFDNLYTIPFLLLFTFVVGILSGSYPAFYLSSFQPSHVMKQKSIRGNKKTSLRSILVIIQFAISITLIIGTMTIKSQLEYLLNKDLGFVKEQLLVVNNAAELGNSVETFKQEISKDANVISSTNSTLMFQSGIPGTSYLIDNSSNEDIVTSQFLDVDYDFVKTFRIKMKEGRFFSNQFSTDSCAVVINESAAERFNVGNLVGRTLYKIDPQSNGKIPFRIIGVIKNFNYESLHQTIRPLAFHLSPVRQAASILSIRARSKDFKTTMERLNETWRRFTGGKNFNCTVLNENLQGMYRNEERIGTITTVFSSLAIFIACLGLFGLAAFVTEKRIKEIGIRKVLGASIPEIILLLSKEFTKWVLLANLVAVPVAYYLMNNWLQDFSYRIEISWWIFALSGLIALLIALATVSYQAIKAALANPVEALRYE